jgi:predicted ATP-grasp superfamily ATP-dependent carboligase
MTIMNKTRSARRDGLANSAGEVVTIALYGEFGPPMLAAARSLSDAGLEIVVLGIGSGKPSVWSSAVCRAELMRPDDVGTPAGISVLNDFIQRTKAQALLAFWEPHMLWLAANRDLLHHRCKLLMSSKEALQAIKSKHDQVSIARHTGFSVLPTWELFQKSDVRRIDPAAYPVCLRPSAPQEVRPPFKAEVLQSPSMLESFLEGRTWGPGPLLVQSFLPLPTVVIHGVRSELGELLVLESFIATMRFQAITLELRPFPLDAKIAECCRKFVNKVGLTGPFHFELLYSVETNTFHFLDINPRLGGTTDKVLRLGFDEPLWTLAAYGFDVQTRQYRAQKGRPVINRRAMLKHILWIMQGRLSLLDYPLVGPLRHLLMSLLRLFWAKDSIASARDLRGTWRLYSGGR